MNNNLKYIGLLIIIILFGIFSLPKIYERVINSDITDTNRLHSNERLSYLTISDEKRKAPDFILTNQDSILISNEDMSGKVYVLEFFFTRCPDICIEMNQNMKLLDDQFFDIDEFGIISVTKFCSFREIPAITLAAMLARGTPVALDTKGTVLEALGLTSMT